MKFLLLVCAGNDFSPPDTIGDETTAWVRRAEATARRGDGGRLRPPEEAVVVGPVDGEVAPIPGPRVADDEQVVGFDVIDVVDMAAAVELLRTHPMARVGRIEIRPVWDDA